MKILVTGVHGFVGNNLVKALSNDNIIYGLDIISPLKEKSRGVCRINTLKLQDNREQLFKDAYSMAADTFIAKYAPNTMKVRMKNAFRYLLWKLGLQNVVRHVKHLVIHK